MSVMVAFLWARFHSGQKDQEAPFSALWLKLPVLLLCLFSGIFLVSFPLVLHCTGHLGPGYVLEALMWSLVMLAAVFFMAAALTEERVPELVRSLFPRIFVFGAAAYAFMAVSLYPRLDLERSAAPFAEKINRAVKDGILVSFDFQRGEFVYYLDRPPFMVIPSDRTDLLYRTLRSKEKVYCLILRRFYYDRLPHLKDVSHRIVLDDLRGWKWDLLLICNDR
jgi:hypothetical protein